MRHNRLFTIKELSDPTMKSVADGWVKTYHRDFQHLQGVRTWEYWAITEGLVTPHRPLRVLDTGSFFTCLPFFMKEMGHEVHATDSYQWPVERQISGYTINVPQWEELCTKHGVHARQADITNLPYQDKSFDVVTCCSTIEHVPDWRKALRELMRVGKRVALTTDVVPLGSDYVNYGRCFSFADLHEIAGTMGVMVNTDEHENHPGVDFTLAVIRQ
jgi:SAM-dependent methyltransferase